MSQYRVIGDNAELPKGAPFTTLPGPVKENDLILVEVGGDEKNLIVGRWYPNIGGCDWIKQPERLIRCTPDVPIRILGVIIPGESSPKSITNLPESEYEHLFKNPFPRALSE